MLTSARNLDDASHSEILMTRKGVVEYAANWRDSVFIEYYFNDANTKCRNYPTEDNHNNFIGIRHMASDKLPPSTLFFYNSSYNNGEPRIQ